MISHRNGAPILICDGCYEPITGKKSLKLKTAPKGTDFHNRKCADRYKHRDDAAKYASPDEVHARYATANAGAVKFSGIPAPDAVKGAFEGRDS